MGEALLQCFLSRPDDRRCLIVCLLGDMTPTPPQSCESHCPQAPNSRSPAPVTAARPRFRTPPALAEIGLERGTRTPQQTISWFPRESSKKRI